MTQPLPAILARDGPVIQVQIGVPRALAASLRAADAIIPNPVDGLALIDTGATITSIHVPILVGLGINPVGIVNVGTADGPKQQNTYPASFSFPGAPLPTFELARAIGCDLSGQKTTGDRRLVALLGRDILV